MEQVLTIVCKIKPTSEQAQKLEMTLRAFSDACNYINATVNPQIKNKNRIQAEVYKNVREQFGLSANLAVRACTRVASNRKTAALKKRPVKAFKPTSADYDARIFSYRQKDQTVSLSTVEGRKRMSLILGNYQIGKLVGKTPTSATLSKHRDGQLYIHIQVKDEAPQPQHSEDIIGVDLGRTDIAVTSLGQSWSGENINSVRDRFSRVRASVQRKGTKGAKRLLKRLSGREKRYQTAPSASAMARAKAQRDTITLRLRYSTVSFQLHPNCGIAPSPLIPSLSLRLCVTNLGQPQYQ